MSNSVLTPTVIANELLMRFENNLCFSKGCGHEYDERFDKIGDTFYLRNGARFVANDGADITAQIQDVTEISKALTIDTRKNVAFQFTSKDLTLTIDRFAERYLDGAAIALANKFETDGLTLAYQKSPNYVGTAGTTPQTMAVVLAAGQKLDESGAPLHDRNLIVSPTAQASLVNVFSSLLNSSNEIGKQYRTGRMGHALGFDWAMSQNVRTHTVGAWGTSAQVNGTINASAETAVTGTVPVSWTGSATGVVKAGDKFTIATCYAVNPVSGDALSTLAQFTVLADATASGSAVSLSVYPPIRTTGPNKTVSAIPVTTSAITPLGTASTGYPMNIAHQKEAFVFATVPLIVPQGVHSGKVVTNKDTGVSLRVISDYDVLTDVFITRVDLAYGWTAPRPEWSAVMIG